MLVACTGMKILSTPKEVYEFNCKGQMYSNVSDGYAYKSHLIFKKKSHVKPAHHT